MYFCPECDEGPFNPQDWWEHFHSHNIPWLRGRDPKNLERTDLGYGEDLNRTTVPTHDMPNEWHELTNPPFDGGLSTDPPGAHMGTTLNGEKSIQQINRDDLWQHYPNASEYEELHEGSHPFMYDPQDNKLLLGKEGEGHYDIFENGLSDDTVWGRYFPHLNGVDFFTDYFGKHEPLANRKKALKALEEYENQPEEDDYHGTWYDPMTQEWKQAAQVIPKAHRMVWLSQPNNRSLKYWHHNPTNTTYAWDSNDMHHWQAWAQLGAGKQAHSPNDWDGGFYIQNQMGRHPSDLWGLPSQVDYAPIQGDGDYGMF